MRAVKSGISLYTPICERYEMTLSVSPWKEGKPRGYTVEVVGDGKMQGMLQRASGRPIRFAFIRTFIQEVLPDRHRHFLTLHEDLSSLRREMKYCNPGVKITMLKVMADVSPNRKSKYRYTRLYPLP